MATSETENVVRSEKCVRYNVPSRADKDEFGAEANHTLHTNGVTVYFDRIREERLGYVFLKYDAEVAWVPDTECDVSPTVAMNKAEEQPNEKVRFSDPVESHA